MNSRIALLSPLAALALIGCVDRGNWKPAPQLAPEALASSQTLHDARSTAASWPTDHWWRSYGDPQLDALVEEALAGSPTLEIAQARLRAAQAQTRCRPRGARAAGCVQRGDLARAFPAERAVSGAHRRCLDDRGQCHARLQLGPRPVGAQPPAAGRRPAGVEAAARPTARLRAWRFRWRWCRRYIQFDLKYSLRDVTDDNLKQQQSILDLTQQRVSAGLENTARVKQSEGTVALTRAGRRLRRGRHRAGAQPDLADSLRRGPGSRQDAAAPAAERARGHGAALAAAGGPARPRPDVAAARAMVEAASRGVKAARGGLLS